MLCSYLIHLLLWNVPCSKKASCPSEDQHNQCDRMHGQRWKEDSVLGCLGLVFWVKRFPAIGDMIKMTKHPGNVGVMADTPHPACCHTNAHCHQRHELGSKSRGKALRISWLLSVCIKSFVSLAIFKWNVDLSIFALNFLLVLKAKSNHSWKVMKHAMLSQEIAHSL